MKMRFYEQFRLDELMQNVWNERKSGKFFLVGNKNNFVRFDKKGRLVEANMFPSPEDRFYYLKESEVTLNTKIDRLVSVVMVGDKFTGYTDPIVYSHSNCSVGEVLRDDLVSVHWITSKGKLLKLWTKRDKFEKGVIDLGKPMETDLPTPNKEEEETGWRKVN